MKAHILFAILLLTTIPIVMASSPPAGPTSITCVQATQTSAGASQTVVVGANVDPGGISNCSPPPGIFVDIPAGSPITLYCRQGSIGVGVLAPTAINIRLVIDNTNFGSNTPTAIRTISANSCIGSLFTTTVYCTSDGTATGTASYGIIRLHVEELNNGGISNYDVNSDNDIWAIYRCNPALTALAESNPQTTYEGGDTIGLSYTTNATPYDSTNSGNGQIVCNAATISLASDAPTTASHSKTTTILGSAAAWPTGCNLAFSYLVTRSSAVSGFTNKAWNTWSGPPPAGITYSNNANGEQTIASITTTKPLNRILTSGSCSVTVNGVSSTIGNRGASFNVNCAPWQDARGSNVPNNQPGRVWFNLANQYRVTSDFPSADGLWGSQGNIPLSITATTSATITTNLAYHQMVEEYSSTARTDSVLMNWGNSSDAFDVTNQYHFDGINMTKCSAGVPTCANVTGFTISADNEYAQAKGLKDINNQILSGLTVTCQRTKPDSTTQSPVTMGTTDLNGNSPIVQFSVDTPAGTWQMTCTTTSNGNTAIYTVSFFHSSAFTANIQINVLWNVTLPQPVNGSAFANISACLREYDQGSDSVIRTFPDDTPKLTIEQYDPSDALHDIDIVSRQLMTAEDGPTSSCFQFAFWTSEQGLRDNTSFAYVTTNFTGSPFMGSQGFVLRESFNGTYYGDGTNLTFSGEQIHLIPTSISIPLAFILSLGAIAFVALFTRNMIAQGVSALLALTVTFMVFANLSLMDSNTSYLIAMIGILESIGLAYRILAIAIENRNASNSVVE